MIKKTMMIPLIVVLGLLVCSTAWAKVSADQAARLGKDLTPLGAEKAGNAEGTIPAWDGGLNGVPEGISFKGSGDFHPDPYKDDKVLFSISGRNVDQYADKLTPGTVAMLKKYDSMRLDVYPTRRSAAAPQWVYDNTKRNATLCELTKDRLDLIHNDGYGGTPFPIPTRGEEVMFNHLLRWRGIGMSGINQQRTVQGNGQIATGSGGNLWEGYPWYEVKKGEEFDGIYFRFSMVYTAPARRNGEVLLFLDPLAGKRRAWQYLPGQRRVRRAPSIAYDTPNPGTSGLQLYDDAWMFNGNLDRFDWKLLGKKEIYIPYNNYAFDLATFDEVLAPLHPNPDLIRWELHRVWLLEATLREGKRHVYGKRHFYMDEDSWAAVLQDAYDGRGSLWRIQWGLSKNAYEIPGLFLRAFPAFDLTREDWTCNYMINELPEAHRYDVVTEDSWFTPEKVRNLGRR